MTLIGNYKPEDLMNKKEGTTLIEALKQLAERYPEKWHIDDYPTIFLFYMNTPDGGTQILIRLQRNREYEWIYSTEDCDRILAEHGLVMWVIPHTDYKWFGQFEKTNPLQTADHTMDPYDHDTKREATEATFLAALEYIIRL
jgi:hypothetical protein